MTNLEVAHQTPARSSRHYGVCGGEYSKYNINVAICEFE